MRSASSPPTVGSTTISNSVVITSMPVSIARLAMPRSARGTMLPKLRLQRDPSPAGFAHHASATGNLTMPAASWTRSGEGASEVVDGLPEPPALSGPGDHLTALVTWHGLLHQDIRTILDEVGPQPQPAIAPSVGDALHAAG